MSLERLEFKILKDKGGTDTDLSNLSLSESKAFLILLDSIISLAESTDLNLGYNIKIEKGSASVAIESQDLAPLLTEYYDILENKSNNAEAVQAFRNVQNLFWENGLTYSSKISTYNTTDSDVFNKIYNSKTFRTKSIRKSKTNEVTFLKGYLQEIGGKKPNFHIDYNESTLKIECTEEQAQRVKDHLYKLIHISVIKTSSPNSKSTFKFIDYYGNVDEFTEYQELIKKGYDLVRLDYLRCINNILKELLKKQDFVKARQVLKLFNNDFTDNSVLKTILIITKAFSEHSSINGLRKNIKEILEKKRGGVLS